jgi:F0F1-type ATP synthase membrane subunit b/b'
VSPTWVTFLFEAANFLLLAAVLGWLFFRPVRDALEHRRSELEGERREAEQARAEAERSAREARERRAELEDSLEVLRERVRREAEEQGRRLLEEARARSQQERDAFKQELVSLRRAQARRLAGDAAFAAREIVVRLLAALEGPDLERMLRAAARRELAKLRSSGSLDPLLVESAGPLDRESLAALAEAAGLPGAETRHRVDPALVAGVRVLTARGLVDASAAGLAAQAQRVLLERIEREEAGHG